MAEEVFSNQKLMMQHQVAMKIMEIKGETLHTHHGVVDGIDADRVQKCLKLGKLWVDKLEEDNHVEV